MFKRALHSGIAGALLLTMLVVAGSTAGANTIETADATTTTSDASILSEQTKIFDSERSVVRVKIDEPNVKTTAPTLLRSHSSHIPYDVVLVSTDYRIDPLLIDSIIRVESGYYTLAKSRKGALGLMQIMPDTALTFGASPAEAFNDPAINLRLGASYLKSLQRKFGNNLPLVLAAYNAGERAVQRYHNQVPPFPETQKYVRHVLSLYLRARERNGKS